MARFWSLVLLVLKGRAGKTWSAEIKFPSSSGVLGEENTTWEEKMSIKGSLIDISFGYLQTERGMKL